MAVYSSIVRGISEFHLKFMDYHLLNMGLINKQSALETSK